MPLCPCHEAGQAGTSQGLGSFISFPAEAEGCLRGLGRISACQPLTQRPCASLNISGPQLPSAEIGSDFYITGVLIADGAHI